MENQTDLVNRDATGMPSTIQKPGRGHEEALEIDELEMPRAKLVQFTSDEAQTDDRESRKEPGLMINSITKEKLGLIFVPIFRFVNFMQWNPRKKDDPNFDAAFEPGALIFTTSDRNDARVESGVKFGPNGELPKVTKYINFLCMFNHQPMPLVLSFAKTSFAAGKRLNSLTQFSGGDMFGGKYRLIVSQKKGDAGAYFAMDVAPVGPATPEEFKIAEHWFNEFRGKTIKVHTEETPKEEKWSE